MKISGKLKNTLFDLQKIFHDQIPSNDKDISSKKRRKKMSKCYGLKKCRTSVSKTPKYRFRQSQTIIQRKMFISGFHTKQAYFQRFSLNSHIIFTENSRHIGSIQFLKFRFVRLLRSSLPHLTKPNLRSHGTNPAAHFS